MASGNQQEGINFLRTINKKTIAITVALSLIWLLFTPFTNSFFQMKNILVPILFTPIIILGALTASNKGFLQGKFNFKIVAAIILLEAMSKFIFAFSLVTLNRQSWVFIAIPISILIAFLCSVSMAYPR